MSAQLVVGATLPPMTYTIHDVARTSTVMDITRNVQNAFHAQLRHEVRGEAHDVGTPLRLSEESCGCRPVGRQSGESLKAVLNCACAELHTSARRAPLPAAAITLST